MQYTTIRPWAGVGAVGMGLALLIDAIGAPYFGLTTASDEATTFFDAVQDQDWSTAFTTLFTAPAVVTDAYLNDSGVPLSDILSALGLSDLVEGLPPFELGSLPVTVLGQTGTAHLGDLTLLGVTGNIPLGGLLAPLGHPDLGADAQYSGGSVIFDPICRFGICITPPPITFSADPDTFSISRELGGTPIGGLAPALVNWAPGQLADSITGTVPGSWSDIANQFQDLPQYLWDQFQLTSLFGDEGWLGLLTSALGADSLAGSTLATEPLADLVSTAVGF